MRKRIPRAEVVMMFKWCEGEWVEEKTEICSCVNPWDFTLYQENLLLKACYGIEISSKRVSGTILDCKVSLAELLLLQAHL